ncbi:MAG: hypothetical protein E6J08_12310 [Chloroflexi bacterium]|nr:MAG: hypothetical protein E6J08_12310 [Chloroflexota bacterium]
MPMTTAGAASAGAPTRSGRLPSGKRKLMMVTISVASTMASPIANASLRLATDHTRRYRWRRASPTAMPAVTRRRAAAGYHDCVGTGLTTP